MATEERKRVHADPPRVKQIADRLRRVEGQVAGIRRMYEDQRYCIDVLDQVAAARRGLEATALMLLEDHVDGCVRDAIDGGEGLEKSEELLAAVRRYVRSI